MATNLRKSSIILRSLRRCDVILYSLTSRTSRTIRTTRLVLAPILPALPTLVPTLPAPGNAPRPNNDDSHRMSGIMDTTANRSSQKKKLNMYPLTLGLQIDLVRKNSLLAQQFSTSSMRNRKKHMLFNTAKAVSAEGGKDSSLRSSPNRTNSVTIIMKSSYEILIRACSRNHRTLSLIWPMMGGLTSTDISLLCWWIIFSSDFRRPPVWDERSSSAESRPGSAETMRRDGDAVGILLFLCWFWIYFYCYRFIMDWFGL
mmetsp:Transcript_18851/g.54345  ORF Transcript_18851/g.54345 Transcript_18851/m.54345 type:complete len:258 (+) Transcript_18851:2802-3575(+)